MRGTLLTGLIISLWAGMNPVQAQPRVYVVGLAVADLVDTVALPSHMQQRMSWLEEGLRQDMRALLIDLGRFRILDMKDLERNPGPNREEVDFIVHAILNKSYKTFFNQVIYYTPESDFFVSSIDGPEVSTPYEVVSLPVINGQLEVQLEDPQKGKIFWSALRDTTAHLPFDYRMFIYNPWKYPGFAHPVLMRLYMADILRLQDANRSANRTLSVSDRWYVSPPDRDVEIARGALAGLAASFSADLHSNLPLEGRIQVLLPERDGKPHVELNIGARHGLVPRLRLDVWRPPPSGEKVGQLEVVTVDSTTAVARLRKLEKKLRKRGEGLQLLDRVISRKRPANF